MRYIKKNFRQKLTESDKRLIRKRLKESSDLFEINGELLTKGSPYRFASLICEIFDRYGVNLDYQVKDDCYFNFTYPSHRSIRDSNLIILDNLDDLKKDLNALTKNSLWAESFISEFLNRKTSIDTYLLSELNFEII